MSSIPLQKNQTYLVIDENGKTVASIILGRPAIGLLPHEITKHTELTLCDKYGNPKTHYMSVDQHQWFRAKWEAQLNTSQSFLVDLKESVGSYSTVLRDTVKLGKHGFVYVLHQIGSDNYKIGHSIDPKKRLRRIIKLPFKVEFFIIIESDDMVALENELHDHFYQKRVNGEWFKLDDADLEYIRQKGA